MRKSLFTIIYFLVSLTAARADSAQTLDGNWIGRMNLRNGLINHELKMKIRKEWPKLIIEEAENENGKLLVTKAELRFSDVHSPLQFIVEMYEFVQDHYYHFTLTGDVVNDNLIQGYAIQAFDDSPHLTNEGRFILVRDRRKPFLIENDAQYNPGEPVGERPIRGAQMTVIEATGIFFEVDNVYIALNQVDENMEPTSITVTYFDENDLVSAMQLPIVEQHELGCGSVEYVAEEDYENERFTILLADHSRHLCHDLPADLWDASVIAIKENETIGTLILRGVSKPVFTVQ